MTNKKDQMHVLPNGFTFLAITSGLRGSWAKATDPVTAIRNAHSASGGKKNSVMVIYGKNDDLHVDSFGGYEWQIENPPTPIGIFTVTDRSIKPLAKGDFNENHKDCLGWMTEQIEDIELWSKEEN